MDWETAFQCWLEIYRGARYADAAVRLLAEEVARSSALRTGDRITLTRLLHEIQRTRRYGRTDAVERVYDIFSQYDGFREQMARIVFERVQGKP